MDWRYEQIFRGQADAYRMSQLSLFDDPRLLRRRPPSVQTRTLGGRSRPLRAQSKEELHELPDIGISAPTRACFS